MRRLSNAVTERLVGAESIALRAEIVLGMAQDKLPRVSGVDGILRGAARGIRAFLRALVSGAAVET